MEKVAGRYLSVILVLSLAIAFSLPVLWLVSSWIAVIFLVYEIAAIVGFVFLIWSPDIHISVEKQTSYDIESVIDVLIVFFPTALLLLSILGFDSSLVIAPIALVCTSFVPGYALMRISGIHSRFSWLEVILFSYLLSYVFTAFGWMFLLVLESHIRSLVFTLAIIALSHLSLLYSAKQRTEIERPPSFARTIDVAALVLSCSLYLIGIFLIYPGFTFLPNSDVMRHFAWAVVLERTPELYIGYIYLFAHLHQSSLIGLTNVSTAALQTTLVFQNLFLPIAFYIACKKLIGHYYNDRVPSIATVIWVLFTNGFGGFSWLVFAGGKFLLNTSEMELLWGTALKTYNGTIYGILGLWYVPATIAFTLLLALLSLLRNGSVSSRLYFLLFSLLFAALFLTHVTEAAILAVFLGAAGLVFRDSEFRLDETLCALILGALLVAGVHTALVFVLVRYSVSLSLILILCLIVAIALISLSIRLMIGRGLLKTIKLPSLSNRVSIPELLTYAAFGLIIVYVIAVVTNIAVFDDFNTYSADLTGIVPWFLYPMILGVTGLLGIAAFLFLPKQMDVLKKFAFVAFFLFIVFILARAVSIVNLTFFATGYWEKRFIWFLKIPLAMLAPVPILVVFDKIRSTIIYNPGKFAAAITISGILVVSGLSTTFLNIEYWHLATNDPEIMPSSIELEALDALQSIFNSDPKAWLATVTDRSAHLCTYSAPVDMLILRELLYGARTPEMMISQLYRHSSYSHPYVYVAERDLVVLNNPDYALFRDYLAVQPIVFENSEVSIYNVSSVIPPLTQSGAVLVTSSASENPPDYRFWANQMLSASAVNYTTALDWDDSILSADTIVLGEDPSLYVTDLKYEDAAQVGWSVVSGIWQVTNQTVQGGTPSAQTLGLILSDFYATEPSTYLEIKPVNPSVGYPNYAGFVHSYQDANHYKTVEIVFHVDGFIHVLTRMVNGTDWFSGTTIPSWPGHNTSIRWSSENWTRAEITTMCDSTQIIIDGIDASELQSQNPTGQIGLIYSRFRNVAFSNVSFGSCSDWSSRLMQKYSFESADQFSNWQIVEGYWTAAGDSIVCGNLTEQTRGVALTPLFLDIFDAEFHLSNLSTTIGVSNYFGFVHSYLDNANYETIEILFNDDGFVYVLTRSVNGTAWELGATNPDWPGSNTGLTWNSESVLDIQIQAVESLGTLLLNGTNALTFDTDGSAGRVGFFYSRIREIVVSDFTISGLVHWDASSSNSCEFVYPTSLDWQIASGHWHSFDSSIVCSSSTTEEFGLILQTPELSMFNMSFTASPLGVSNNLSAALGVAHSYRSEIEFSLIELVFAEDGYIHVLLSSMNGPYWKAQNANPDYPGWNTGVPWLVGQNHEVAIAFNLTGISVCLNGSLVFSDGISNEPGRVGLFSYGLDKTSFTDYHLTAVLKSSSRPIGDYLDFVTAGHSLVVVNTNGYNWFGDELLDFDGFFFDSTRVIDENGTESFPLSMPVQKATAINTSTVKLFYESLSGQQSAFVLAQEYGLGTVFYVNLYPIIKAFYNGFATLDLLEVFLSVCSTLNLQRLSEFETSSQGYAKLIHLREVTLNTSAIVWPNDSLTDSVIIRSGSQEFVYHQMADLHLASSELCVETEYMRIAGGTGFYSYCIFNSSLTIKSSSTTIPYVEIETPAGHYRFLNVTEVVLVPETSCELLARLPDIEADSAIFEVLYSQMDLYQITGVYGSNLFISGGLSLSIGLSDSFISLQEILIASSWYAQPRTQGYDELSSLAIAVPVALAMTSIGILIFILLRKKRIL